jgi:hypothetical protein
MRKKLNPAKSGVDFQQVIRPALHTGRYAVIINSVELNILIGGRKPMNVTDIIVGAALFTMGCVFYSRMRKRAEKDKKKLAAAYVIMVLGVMTALWDFFIPS